MLDRFVGVARPPHQYLHIADIALVESALAIRRVELPHAKKALIEPVCIGNVPGHSAENPYCPQCHHLVEERAGFTITQMNLYKGKCQNCQNPISGE